MKRLHLTTKKNKWNKNRVVKKLIGRGETPIYKVHSKYVGLTCVLLWNSQENYMWINPKIKHDMFKSFKSKDNLWQVSNLCDYLRKKRIKTFSYEYADYQAKRYGGC